MKEKSIDSTPRGLAVSQLTEQLQADIIFGRLRPYQELVEDVLIERFQTKRHVVRAAIEELVAKQIVTKAKGRSARVKDFSLEEVHELYQMRALLQKEAVRSISFPVSEEKLNVLKSLHVQYAAAASVGAEKLMIHRYNDDFHRQLFSLCGNKVLCKAIEFYTEATNPIRSYGIADPRWLEQAINEHVEMIRALEYQDVDKLMTLVVEHMQPTRLRWESMRTGISGTI